jgi:hypothetical protein
LPAQEKISRHKNKTGIVGAALVAALEGWHKASPYKNTAKTSKV